jgi:hypothetical protein
MEIKENKNINKKLRIFLMKIYLNIFYLLLLFVNKNVFVFEVVALAKRNPNVAMVLSFLYKCVDTFVCYFKDLEEESVRDNFVVIYELLDEMLDFG